MIRLFCKKLHRQIDLCPDCQEVLSYAMDRSDLCPLIERKTLGKTLPQGRFVLTSAR